MQKIQFTRENIPELIKFVGANGHYLRFQVGGGFGDIAAIEICGTREILQLRDGDYLIKTDEVIPNMFPTVYRYEVECTHKEPHSGPVI